MQPGDSDRQRLGLEPVALAGAAGAVVLVALELLTHPSAVGLAIAPLHVGDHPFERPLYLVDPTALVVAEPDLRPFRSVKQHASRLLWQVAPPLGLVEAIVLGQRLDGLPVVGRLTLGPGRDRALEKRQALVGHDQARIEEQLHPEPVAGGAGPERRVEREEPRLDFRDGEARHRTGELLRKGEPLRLLAIGRRGLQDGDAVREIERGAQAVGEPRLQPLAHHDPVHHHVDVVPELLVELRGGVEIVEFAVHLHPLEAALQQVSEFLAILTLPVAHDRRQQVGAGSLRQRHDDVDHLADLLRLDRLAGRRRVRRADPREQEAHVVVDLGDRADGRARVLRCGLLLDRDRRRQARDMVHVRLLHHVEELPGVGRQALDIAPLALGVDRVEGET